MKRGVLFAMIFLLLIGGGLFDDLSKLFRPDAAQALANTTVTSITPNVGGINGGTDVVILGLFGDTDNDAGTVTIGGVNCVIKGWGNTRIDCTTGAHAVGSVNVVVTPTANNGPAFTVTNGFTYAPMATAGSTLSLAVSQPTVEISPSITTGGLASGSSDVTVTTNYAGGYNLSIGSAPTAGDNTNSLVGAGDSIASTTGTITAPATLANNQWGFAVASGQTGNIASGFDASYATPTPAATSKWAAVPAVGSSAIIRNQMTASAGGGDSLNVYFGVKIDVNKPADTYTRDVMFTAVTNATVLAPTITAVTPNSGSIQGGNAVVISGTSLTSAHSVTIGGQSCTSLAIVSDNQVTCNAPTGNVGAKDVVVTNDAGSATLTGGYTYTDNELFSFDVNIPAGSLNFIVPVMHLLYGYSGAIAYNWTIDWGDGNTSTASGNSAYGAAGIPHNYSAAGIYVVTIRPTTNPVTGWMSAFGFDETTTGAGASTNQLKMTNLLTPFSSLGRIAREYEFFDTFLGITGGNIPATLLANFDTSQSTNFMMMFNDIFQNWASTTATIPAGLFRTLNTANGTNFSNTFDTVFAGWASTVVTIPTGLFSVVNTAKGTNFTNTFDSTFANWTTSTAATIPTGLFDTIDTSHGTMFANTFNSTFSSWLVALGATIPTGLFRTITTVNATSVQSMFAWTFNGWNATTAIPAGLFGSVTVTSAMTLATVFQSTFEWALLSINMTTTDIFAGANLSGITADNADSTLDHMFAYDTNATGLGQAFINRLGGWNPTARAYTFYVDGSWQVSGLSDYNTIDANWR